MCYSQQREKASSQQIINCVNYVVKETQDMQRPNDDADTWLCLLPLDANEPIAPY